MSMRRVLLPVGGSTLAAMATTPATFDATRHFSAPFQGINRWRFPGGGEPVVTKEQLNAIKFQTKSRQQWDYQGINERIDESSEFRKKTDRPDFDGPRPDNTTCFEGSLKNAPHFKRLEEYFDEYTQPGTDKKLMAAMAVKEHWDATHFYYPGEAWQRNRPSFRSVPAELLNKQTWYHWLDLLQKHHEIMPTSRPRNWNPLWPPPGYQKPPFWTKREFQFGPEEPGLLSEIERWYWFRQWFESNQRHGPYELWCWFMMGMMMYSILRNQHGMTKMRAMLSNQYYPGRQCVRSYGEPKDWANEVWWWQQPLETFPNQGEVWYYNEVRFKYINHIKKRDEEAKLKAALGEA